MSNNDIYIWQIGAGSDGRGHHELFLKYDLMLIGPGRAKAWPWDDATRSEFAKDVSFVRSFAEEVKAGDIVLLRQDSRTVLAIGRVADNDYQWHEQFADIDGWDLHHTRRVKWHAIQHSFSGKVFGRASRLSGVGNREVRKWADTTRHEIDRRSASDQLKPLLAFDPRQHAKLPDTAIPEHLRPIVQTLRQITSKAVYANNWPSEHEMVVHVVVPLLRALGWPDELIGVEWNRIDLALFDKTPRTTENLHVIIEAKRHHMGTYWAGFQAERYRKKLDATAMILATDGARYRLFSADRPKKPNDPPTELAYGNLRHLTESGLEVFERLRFRGLP